MRSTPSVLAAPSGSASRPGARGEGTRRTATGPDEPESARLERLAFDLVPHGLALFDRAGVVAVANGAFRALVPAQRRRSAMTCCEVLCRYLPSAAPACLTKHSLSADEPIRGLRVQLPGVRAPISVTGAPLHSEDLAVVIGLDAVGATPDPARPATDASLLIHALGRTEVDSPHGRLGGEWLDQRPGQLLRFLIAERGRLLPVEEIAEAIWPDGAFGTRNSVRHLVHVLRERLEPWRSPGAPSGSIVSRGGGYMLNTDCVAVDADAFADAARAALAAHAADASGVERRLRDALALYTGEFLSEAPYAEWAHAERERLQSLAEDLLHALCERAVEREDVAAASDYLEQLAEMEPFDSDIHRGLIALSLRRGRRGRALRQYNAFRLRLASVFGEDVDFGLADLYHGDPFAASSPPGGPLPKR